MTITSSPQVPLNNTDPTALNWSVQVGGVHNNSLLMSFILVSCGGLMVLCLCYFANVLIC